MLLAAEPSLADTSEDVTAESTPAPVVGGALVEETTTGALNLLSSEQGGGDFAFLQQQIYRGEAPSAQSELETIVSQIEAVRHRYDEALVVPLTLLGDAYMVQREYDKALDHYDRARHTARVNYGLFDPRQLPVVYREADAFKKIGDLASAGQREEYAYEVMHKSMEPYDPKLLPGLMRLAGFYLETYNYLSARTLFNRAMSIHTSSGKHFTLDAIPALQGIALTHRLERFPPFYVSNTDDNRMRGPTPGLNTSDLDNQFVAFNNFPAGEKALQQIIEIHRQQEPEDPQATLDAIVTLADWHLLFGRSNTANTLYSHVYEKMAENGADASRFFGNPKLLYIPLPQDPKPPPASKRQQVSTGKVQLGFNVAPSGRVRKLTTLESMPEDLMDFRVRRSMRLAVFRPMLVEGVPVTAEAQEYTHEFSYYPTADQVLTASTTEPEGMEEGMDETSEADAAENSVDSEVTENE